jgi:protein SCO1/2
MRAALALALPMLATAVLAWAALIAAPDASGPQSSEAPSLPKIGPAPVFTLTSQDGLPVRLVDFRGKVVAVTFIYTLCTATCPVLTPMQVMVQDRLGKEFGRSVGFVSITLDPERDTPKMLKLYAQAYGADLGGWTFLTGSLEDIRDLAARYGIYSRENASGALDHSLLTSLVDRRGLLRVQYLGARFDPEEFRRDLLSLAKER